MKSNLNMQILQEIRNNRLFVEFLSILFDQKKHQPNKFKKLFIEFSWQLLFYVISVALVVKEWIVELALGWYLGDTKTSVPPLTDENSFLSESATQLAQKIRERKLTSHQLVSATIKRMKEVNKVLNAIVDGPFEEEALTEAKRIDERIAAGLISEDEFSEKPFLGIPFTSKDSTAAAGKLHTLGLLSRKAVRAKEDAECVALTKSAGAILLATTNVPEVNKW